MTTATYWRRGVRTGSNLRMKGKQEKKHQDGAASGYSQSRCSHPAPLWKRRAIIFTTHTRTVYSGICFVRYLQLLPEMEGEESFVLFGDVAA